MQDSKRHEEHKVVDLPKMVVNAKHKQYAAFCQRCGKVGYYIDSFDDRGRSATKWIHFENEPSVKDDRFRKKAGDRDHEQQNYKVPIRAKKAR